MSSPDFSASSLPSLGTEAIAIVVCVACGDGDVGIPSWLGKPVRAPSTWVALEMYNELCADIKRHAYLLRRKPRRNDSPQRCPQRAEHEWVSAVPRRQNGAQLRNLIMRMTAPITELVASNSPNSPILQASAFPNFFRPSARQANRQLTILI